MMQTAVDLPNVYADDYDKLLTINDFNVIACFGGDRFIPVYTRG